MSRAFSRSGRGLATDLHRFQPRNTGRNLVTIAPLRIQISPALPDQQLCDVKAPPGPLL